MARITLPSGTPAELARPPGDAAAASGLVIVPDIGGLRPLFDDLVARLSDEHGWAVAAVDPFPGRTFPDGDLQARFAVMAEMDDARLLADLVDAAQLLATEPVGCIGFCMGGMYALKAASTGAFRRICAFYGMVTVPEDWQGPGQGQPLDHLARAPDGVEVMAMIGGDDPYTPADEVEQLRRAGVEIAFYPEAGHGFAHDPSRPAHRPDDAADAWRRAIAHLAS